MITPRYLHGLHDAGGEHLMWSRPGWVVITEAIGDEIPVDRSAQYIQTYELGPAEQR